MNVRDSDEMGAILEGAGFKSTDHPQNADLIILNTCSIREKAAQKVYSQLGRFSGLKRQNPGLIIGIGGCLAQQWGENFLKKAPCLDLVFGTQRIRQLPELVGKVEKCRRPVVDTAFQDAGACGSVQPLPKKGQVGAYVTIMRGCDNFCSYCIVPYLRGSEESREPADILAELAVLAEQGIKEVTLLGQNVNSYGKTLRPRRHFHDLIREIALTEKIERLRFTTSHPKDLSPELIRSFAEVNKMCEHIHLPVQSGSDKVLRAMNRGYKKVDYLKKVEQLRESCPGISVTSDIIVGFPGESDADFEETIDLMEKVRFDNLFSFKYSERPGTTAAKLEQKVGERVKSDRLKFLQLLQERHTLEKNQALVGKVVEVLVEGISRNSTGEIMGRTRTNKIVNFKGGMELLGETLSVTIKSAYQHSLRGELSLNKGENIDVHRSQGIGTDH